MESYFAFYGLPVQLLPDEDVIKRKYYELSRKYHPDLYTLGDEDSQQQNLELSTRNNEAFRTLSRFDRRLVYVLYLEGVMTEGEKYNLPPAFLAEMLDLNEKVMEAGMGDTSSLDEAKEELEKQLRTLNRELQAAAEAYDKTGDKDKLLVIKDLYYRQKYLFRLQDSISNIVP